MFSLFNFLWSLSWSSLLFLVFLECLFVVKMVECETWILNSDVDCKNVVSIKSGTSDDARTSVSCDAGYTMTGCTAYTKWKNLDGSYISGGKCYARNGLGGNGVWAYGRCCNIHVSSCENRRSSKSGTCDDCSTTVSCSNNNFVLTGCTHTTAWKDMDGGYAGAASDRYKYQLSPTNNYCTARNGINGNGIYAEARCCKSEEYYKLECKTIWGEKSGSGDDATSEITCPNGYFLSGCSSYTKWNEMDGAYFSGDRCIAQNGIGGGGVWSVAVCCKEYYTPAPTNFPTDKPTNVPGW